MSQFQLGCSPDSWDSLRQEMLKIGYRESELIAAGLVIEKERGGGTYDRFRNRLMFPIRDMTGRVLGFGARALDESLPKYLNSPQTLVFDKSNVLYGIDHAKSTIRKQNLAVIVEGYMDVIVAHQYNFSNVVASLGTALTEKQVRLIKKLTKSLALALDADAAGEMATLRGIEVASHTFDQKVVPFPTSAGLVKYEDVLDAEISVMVLPAGKDPDDIIKENPKVLEVGVAGVPDAYRGETVKAWVVVKPGETLTEEIVYDRGTGAPLNFNWIDYQIPTMADMPEIDPLLLEVWRGGGEYGACGMGEAA